MPTWWVEINSEKDSTVSNLFSNFLKALKTNRSWRNQAFLIDIIFLKLLYAAAIMLHKYGYRYLLFNVEFFTIFGQSCLNCPNILFFASFLSVNAFEILGILRLSVLSLWICKINRWFSLLSDVVNLGYVLTFFSAEN